MLPAPYTNQNQIYKNKNKNKNKQKYKNRNKNFIIDFLSLNYTDLLDLLIYCYTRKSTKDPSTTDINNMMTTTTTTTTTTTSLSTTITAMMMMMLTTTTTTPTTSAMTAATNKQHQRQQQQKKQKQKQQHRYEWHLKKMETSSQKHSLACNLILLLIFSCWLPDFIMGLKDVTVTIPQAVKRGSNALLTCNYDMENDTLYSVKWYKGRREFYRYTPKENPAMKVFPSQAGLIVERNLSNQSHVVLLTVPLTVSGKFTCEISVEAPSFQTAMVSGEMEIVELPVEQATVTGIQPRYRIGDLVDGNCSIKFSKPAANLTWTINGIVVPPHHIKTYQIEKYEENNLESVLSAIHFMVTTQHFVKGQMRLKCTATIFDIFKEEIESIIEEDRPRIMASGRSYDMHNYPYDPHGHGEGGYEDHNESYLTYYSAADISSGGGAAAAALPTLPSVATLIAVVVVASVCNIYKNYLQQYVHEIYDKFYTLLTHSLKAHHQMLTTFVINLSLWWWRCCASRTNGNGISNYDDNNNVKKRQDTSAQGQQHNVTMTTVHNLSSYHRMAAVVFTVEFLFLWLKTNKTSDGPSMRVNEMQNNCSSVELKLFKKEKHNNNNNKSYKCNCKRIICEKEEEKCCEKQNEHKHKQQQQQQHNGQLCCCHLHLKISSYYREQQEYFRLVSTVKTTTTIQTITIKTNQKAVNDLLNTVTTKLETVINLTHIDCQQLSQTYGTNATNTTIALIINHTNTNAPYTIAKVILFATLMSYVVRVDSFLTFKTIRTISATWLVLLLLFLLYLELPCKNGNDNDNDNYNDEDDDDDDDDDDSDSSNLMSKDQTLLMTTPTTTVVGVATHCQHRQQQQLKDALTTTNTFNHMIPSLSTKQTKYYQATKATAKATATTLHVFSLSPVFNSVQLMALIGDLLLPEC